MSPDGAELVFLRHIICNYLCKKKKTVFHQLKNESFVNRVIECVYKPSDGYVLRTAPPLLCYNFFFFQKGHVYLSGVI